MFTHNMHIQQVSWQCGELFKDLKCECWQFAALELVGMAEVDVAVEMHTFGRSC